MTDLESVFVSAVSGEVWISQDGEYVVKMLMHGTGTMPQDDESETEVVLDMTWDLLSVNQPVVITPPAGFSEEDMLPIMEGALTTANYFSTADMAMYEVQATAEEVLKWYEDTLTADGWTKDSEDQMEGMSSGAYSKEGTTLTVMVLDSDTEGAVSVMVTRGQ